MHKTKPELLKHHRHKKRTLLLFVVLIAIGLDTWLGFVWSILWLLIAWVAHEVWFSDHLFYRPDMDYHYHFGDAAKTLPITFAEGCLRLSEETELDPDDTLILSLSVRTGGLGRLFDPVVRIETGREYSAQGFRDDQTFEPGAHGVRYLNLTGLADALQKTGVRLGGHHCRLEEPFQLWRIRHPDYRKKRLLVIAPHADDAELAAFGLYRQARESWIVTLTAGEIEAEHYQRIVGLNSVAASRLKGRLRAWDSVAVPQWAGIPAERAIQLGYFCLQLSAMQAAPDQPIASRESDLRDTRLFRTFNRILLSSDANGAPSWNTLLADLREIFRIAKPEVIVLPHPSLDPHPDHVAAYDAVLEALRDLDWQPETLLCYANHLHNNDRWPMGNVHTGIALPPLMEHSASMTPWSLTLDSVCQTDKAMALGMMHDLSTPLPFKKRLRRALQRLLARRRYPAFGENEFFRKTIRRHELFWSVPW